MHHNASYVHQEFLGYKRVNVSLSVVMDSYMALMFVMMEMKLILTDARETVVGSKMDLCATGSPHICQATIPQSVTLTKSSLLTLSQFKSH